jgi:hypothetical protein
MFGYLPVPCHCQIGDQANLYRSVFCGLCNALAAQFGQGARLLVNRDSTFVALLAAAQTTAEPDATLSTRCQPWRRPMPVFEVGPAPAFAAAVTLCGLQAKLADERVDERGLRATGARLLATLSRARFGHARATLAATGFAVAEVWRQLAGQSDIEARVTAGGDPALALQPTARAFEAILAHTARLAGNHANIAPLAQVGRSLGELVYTLDAYQDLDADLRRGRFNFLAAQTDPRRADGRERVRDRARALVTGCQAQLRQAWGQIELLRYRPVLEAVVMTGLAATAERAFAPGGSQSKITSGRIPAARKDQAPAAHEASCGDRCNACYCPSGCDCSPCGQCCSHGCCCDGDCSGCDCGSCDCNSCDCGGCSS